MVLDEATASIDAATDVILEGIIRQEFSGCTVITIAHRVPTVIDSNMVMVLSDGNIPSLYPSFSSNVHVYSLILHIMQNLMISDFGLCLFDGGSPVLVGEIVEFDVPSKLMETNSSFSKLVAEYWSICNRNSLQSSRCLQRNSQTI